MKLSEMLGYDYKRGEFVIGSHDLEGNVMQASKYNEADVNAFLAELANSPDKEQHELLAANIVEPIEQVVPYVEMYGPIFFMQAEYGELEDNSIPVEDIVTMAWETHEDSAVLFTRVGMTWTRPDFTTWDTGIEVPWETLKKAGWNFLARQMKRAVEDLARKRDELSKNVLKAGVLATHSFAVSGGKLTKASVDTVLKSQADIGFPVNRALVNPGTFMDMADFTWGGTGYFMPPKDASQLLRTLHLTDYGGVAWYTNPFAPTDEVIFGGAPSQIGWHQSRGAMKTASDVDIRNKADFHAVYDAEHAYYVGNQYTLAKLVITS